MRILFTIIVISLLLNFNSVTFAGHANEKYCFNCSHKYKIGNKENDTYEFEFDLIVVTNTKLVIKKMTHMTLSLIYKTTIYLKELKSNLKIKKLVLCLIFYLKTIKF